MPRYKLCGLLMVALLLSACATFETGELTGLDRWSELGGGTLDEQGQAGPWVHLITKGLPDKFRDGWRRGIVAEIEHVAAGVEVIERTTSAFSPANAYVQFAFEHSRQGLWPTRIWMGVCALSATVIPARTVQYFGITATFSDAEGKQLGQVHRSVSGQTWVGVLTLFALPFAGGGLGELVRDSTRSILVEARENGWI